VATMAKHASDVMRVCKEAEVSRAFFCGISIGGYVMFELWREHPEKFAAMVLCNTKATPDDSEAKSNRLRTAEDVLQRGPEQFVESMIPKLLGETTRRNRQDIA